MTVGDFYPWQVTQKTRLLHRVHEGTLPHALLFNGPKHLGKLHFAESLAGYLLCSSPQDENRCGLCDACHLVNAGSHPDLRLIEPEESRQIRVDQIREVIDFANQTAQMGGYRVIIIHPAEAMNINSANALLKVLEEPGDSTLIMLVSHQSGSLLATVRSRCQRVDFQLPEAAVAESWLQEQGVTGNLMELLGIAGGSPLKVSEALDPDMLQNRQRIAGALTGVVDGQVSVIAAAKELSQLAPEFVIEVMLALMLDALKSKLVGPQQALVNQDLSQLLSRLGEKLGRAGLLNLMDQLSAERRALSHGANPNTQLLMESLLAGCRPRK